MPKNVLVILPNNLGDVIMATPVLEGLKKRGDGCRISFLVEKGFEAGLEVSPHCDTIVRFDRKQVRDALRSPSWRNGIAALGEFSGVLNRERFDSVINLCQHGYIVYLAAIVAAADKKGRRFLAEGNESIDDPWSRYLYAVPFGRRYNRLHATDVYRLITGVTDHRGGYTVCLSPEEKRRAAEYLSAKNSTPAHSPLAVFQPGAAFPAKRWPAEHFIALGKMLVSEGWSVVLSGAPAEAGLCAHIAVGIGDSAVSLAGETTFRQALAMLPHAAICVTGDTALMHAAAALDVQTYAIFGPTNPVETGPYGNGHMVFCGSCASRPCFCESCKSMLCMKSVMPQTLFDAILKRGKGEVKDQEAYRTRLQPDGDFSLVPVGTPGMGYFENGGSYLTAAAIAPNVSMVKPSKEELVDSLEESRRFCALLEPMINDLYAFGATGDAAQVTQFERRKEQFESLRGIGMFWAALFNIRINSIPLLDPVAGIARTAVSCEELSREILAAVESVDKK